MKLTVRRRDGAIVCRISQRDVAQLEYACSEAIANDSQRWIKNGLIELVNDGDGAKLRHTLSNDLEFLPRLRDYLNRHFGSRYFLVELE